MSFIGSIRNLHFTRTATAIVLALSFSLPCFATFSLDPTFGSGGKIIISFPDSSTGYSSEAFRVFVQPGGRIVVGGTFTRATADGQLAGVAIVGLEPGGLIDPTFAQTLDWRSDASTSFRDAHFYSDGSMLRMSQVLRLPAGSSTVRAARTAANGADDSVFASNASIGPCCFGFFAARPVQIAVRGDGKILALITDNGEFFLYRLNADGTRDTTFGVNGIMPVRFNRISTPSNFNTEMVALNDGKVLIVGHVEPFGDGSSKFFLARLTEAGMPDKTFGRMGFTTVEFGAGLFGFVRRAILQPDGKILLAGNISASDLDVWMARFRPNGRLDTSFGNGGFVISDLLPGGTDVAASIALSPDNKIRIAGWIGSPTNFLVARFSTSGSLEDSTTIPFTPNQFSWANDVTLQPDGKVVVVGRTKNPDTATSGGSFAVARLTE